jgi:hypothetical protein
MVIGRAAPEGGSNAAVAKSIAGVDRQTYRERLSPRKRRAPYLPIGMIVLGLAGMFFGFRLGRRIWRGE